MKRILILLISLSCFIQVKAQEENKNYDKVLAEKLEADDYGMKKFVLVILKSGSNTSEDKEAKSEAFQGHFENMNAMLDQNKLMVSGPIGKNEKSYRGIFILNVKTIEEAEKLIINDSAISQKYLAYELYEWYGSAALGEYLDEADKVWKKKP